MDLLGWEQTFIELENITIWALLVYNLTQAKSMYLGIHSPNQMNTWPVAILNSTPNKPSPTTFEGEFKVELWVLTMKPTVDSDDKPAPILL